MQKKEGKGTNIATKQMLFYNQGAGVIKYISVGILNRLWNQTILCFHDDSDF